MNEDSRLQTQLERATAREPGGPELEPETAELRAGWLALGRLLDAAAGDVDEAGLVHVVVGAERRRRIVRAAALLAVAASLAIILFGGWHWTHRPRGNASPMIATPDVKPKPKVEQPAPADAAIAWDDRLDDQFSQLARSIVGFERPWSEGDSAFTALGERVQRVEQDFGEQL